jgi:outer membrane protein TolC
MRLALRISTDPVGHWLALPIFAAGLFVVVGGAPAQTLLPDAPLLTLRQAVNKALLHNRQLQIERINPQIAALTLRAAYAPYDPVFTSRAYSDSATDTGASTPQISAVTQYTRLIRRSSRWA